MGDEIIHIPNNIIQSGRKAPPKIINININELEQELFKSEIDDLLDDKTDM